MSAAFSRRSVATLSRLIKSTSDAPTAFSINAAVFRRIQGKPYKSYPLRSCRTFHSAVRRLQVAAQEEQAPIEENNGPITTFKELGDKGLVEDAIVRTIIRDMKIETMTQVQAQTIDSCLQGKDVLAQAKTGTGKTLGFLIPTIQRTLNNNPDLKFPSRRHNKIDIRTLIISPTRELAEQIAAEAKKVLRNTGIQVQTAVGGTQKNFHLRQMQQQGCHLLVATPGRLTDLLSDKYAGITVDNLDALVLDEADRLLDDGFAPALYDIHDILPKKSKRPRQTLMFSATMPKEVMHIVKDFMSPGYEFIKTVREDEVPTHDRIPQKVVRLAALQNFFPALIELVKREQEAAKKAGKHFKAMCFFNANAEAVMYHEMYEKLGQVGSGPISTRHPLKDITSVEMHSKLSQPQRTRNSERFRRAEDAIMFSSDVTARGMDFPGVTHVIQLGAPRDRDYYIHRIGRTGRAGKEGEGWIFVNPIDEWEARSLLRGLPIKRDKTLQTSEVDMTQDAQLPVEVATTLTQAVQAAQRTKLMSKRDMFKAYFGTHQWFRNKEQLLEGLNDLSKYGWGMARPPAVDRGFARKLGLDRFRILNTDIEADEDQIRKEEMELRRRSDSRSGGSYGRDRGRGFARDRDRGFGGRGSNRGSQFGGRSGPRGGRLPMKEADPWA